jgi:translocator protein
MSNSYLWYTSLIKPAWAPPSWLFGPVWTVLYIIIALTFGYVFYKILAGKIPRIVAVPFVLNLISNFAFTPIQFGLKNNLLAAIDITIVATTLIWALISIYRYKKLILYANIPYLLWVLFASALQFTITYLNKG